MNMLPCRMAADHFVVKPITVKEVSYSRPNIIVIIVLIQTQSCEYVHVFNSNNINEQWENICEPYTYERAIDWLCQSTEYVDEEKNCDGREFFARLFSFCFYDLSLCCPYARLSIHKQWHTHVYHFMLIWFVIVLILLSKYRSTSTYTHKKRARKKVNGTHTRNNLIGSNQKPSMSTHSIHLDVKKLV